MDYLRLISLSDGKSFTAASPALGFPSFVLPSLGLLEMGSPNRLSPIDLVIRWGVVYCSQSSVRLSFICSSFAGTARNGQVKKMSEEEIRLLKGRTKIGKCAASLLQESSRYFTARHRKRIRIDNDGFTHKKMWYILIPLLSHLIGECIRFSFSENLLLNDDNLDPANVNSAKK
ncbi:hypothetical protein CDAR_416701 [Caerostris darwini]|uniref:Uncharacterized protein n=1 Tax=Caerostris darwini TaxID=1538125 RepID=A0AAV4WPB0_9ARAC|nr:hypothetical protein CDAR_416701 [Caerostris darwini]